MRRPRDADGFDPFVVLGIAPGADKEEIRRAYVGLAKNYHPDRYATAELPDEVRSYLADMARRINAALRRPRHARAQAGDARRAGVHARGRLRPAAS